MRTPQIFRGKMNARRRGEPAPDKLRRSDVECVEGEPRSADAFESDRGPRWRLQRRFPQPIGDGHHLLVVILGDHQIVHFFNSPRSLKCPCIDRTQARRRPGRRTKAVWWGQSTACQPVERPSFPFKQFEDAEDHAPGPKAGPSTYGGRHVQSHWTQAPSVRPLLSPN